MPFGRENSAPNYKVVQNDARLIQRMQKMGVEIKLRIRVYVAHALKIVLFIMIEIQ